MPPPHALPFTLKVLGGAFIAGPDGPVTGRAAQRHRLALVALLAATPRGMTRAKVMTLLWPEREPAQARHALSDSLYRINDAVGGEAVVAAGSRDLRLDDDVLPSDLASFRRALGEGRWERAAEIYAGPFLDGFHLPRSVEFERWVDGERDRLNRLHADALESMAAQYSERGDLKRAAAAWRRLAALDPHDSRIAMQLMETLAAQGNPGAALRHAQIHAELLDQEFGTGPNPDVISLAERIRHGRSVAPGGELDGQPSGMDARCVDLSRHRPGVSGRQTSAMPVACNDRIVNRSPAADMQADAGANAPVSRRQPGDRWKAWTRTGVGAGGAIAVTLAAAWVATSGAQPSDLGTGPAPNSESVAPLPTADTTPSIAVLPFEDLSAESNQAWFADGVAEEIMQGLERVEDLRVVARQSSFAFRDTRLDVRRIAHALGVEYIVDGSVRRGGDSAWVSAQLIDGATGFQRWSETWATKPTAERLRAIQNRIAREVAAALSLPGRAAPELARVLPSDRANDTYLEAQFLLRRFQSGADDDPRTILNSIEQLERVVEEEPDWAPGWAAIGEAHHWAAFHGLAPYSHRVDAKHALEKALALDPHHPQANASLGYILHRLDHDYEAAESYLARALALDSEQYWHCGYSLVLLWAERYEEAVEATRRAQGNNPMFWPLENLLAMVYRCAGQFDNAVRQARAALADRPKAKSARRELALALERSGRVEDALEWLEQPGEPSHYLDLVRALILARTGRLSEAESLIGRVDAQQAADWASSTWPSKTVTAAPVHASALVALGHTDDAIDVLQAAVDRDPDALLYDRCYAELRSLEGYPRYQELLRRTGVPK